jgi:hypothetical protein
MTAEFANSIIIGTQIYGRLCPRMPKAADVIGRGTELALLFHKHDSGLDCRHGKSST